MLKLGTGKWKGENVIRSFYILTAVELEDSALNLLPGIEKWYLPLKVVNIKGSLTKISLKRKGMKAKPCMY